MTRSLRASPFSLIGTTSAGRPAAWIDTKVKFLPPVFSGPSFPVINSSFELLSITSRSSRPESLNLPLTRDLAPVVFAAAAKRASETRVSDLNRASGMGLGASVASNADFLRVFVASVCSTLSAVIRVRSAGGRSVSFFIRVSALSDMTFVLSARRSSVLARIWRLSSASASVLGVSCLMSP